MPKKTINVVAIFKAEPGKSEELKIFLNNFVVPALKKAGCLKQELQQSLGNPDGFTFREEWNSQIAFGHLQKAHLQEGLESVGELMSVGPDFGRKPASHKSLQQNKLTN